MTMRILHCIPGLGGGGSERQVTYLSRQLAAQGWDVHVAAVSGGPNRARLLEGGVRVHRLSARGNHDPRLFGQLVRTMRAVKPDVVQVWLLQMEILGGLAATMLRVPWILSERSSAPAYPPSVKHRLRVVAARGAAAIVANSAGGDQYWRPRVTPRVARYVVANAVPLEEIDAEEVAAPEETGIEPGQRMVLFVGRLCADKNLDGLLPALRTVLAEPATVAAICGEGPLRAEVERRLADWGLEHRVRRPGYVQRVWRWMKRADVFVAPSLFEGQPNAVLEAMACGSPLVVSDIPAHREVLDASSAVFAPPDDSAALAREILGVLAAPAVAVPRARAARARAAALSVPAMARGYCAVYESVLAARGAGRPETVGSG